MRQFVLLLMLTLAPPAWAAHAYAQFGDIRYPAGFSHFDWVNPEAPRGGEITLVPTRPFDKAAFLARTRKLREAMPETEPVVERMRKEARY